jgi:hypothetical protein
MNLFLNIFFFSVSISYILFVWNYTNAFIEYYKILKLKFLSSANSYIKQNEAGFVELYVEYLKKSDNFFAKLFSCPVCLGFWLSLLSIPFVNLYFLSVSYFSLLLYVLLSRLFNYDHQ